MTERKLFCDGWSFREAPLDTPYEDALSGEFTPVEIPHDYMIYDVNALYRDGEGWYKRVLNHKPDGRIYILRFEGVYMDSTVFVNGEPVFEWKYGYSTFEADITSALKEGENVIAVRCVYRDTNTRWYSGAGIYRRVWLITADEARLPSDGVYISAMKSGDGWKVHIDTEKIGKGTIVSTILTEDGSEIAKAEGDSVIMYVSSPRLWDPVDPYRYTLLTEYYIDGALVDRTENKFGFRTAEFDCNRGFILNGRPYKLHGVCEHHDNGALGSAVNENALRRKIEKLKTMGVNSIRTSHNMPAVELVELCDELGIVIIDEAFDMWEHNKTRYDYACFFKDWYRRDVESWIKRDRNHPCVIMWSIGNEIGDTTNRRGYEVAATLAAEVRIHDPRRNAAVTIGSNHMRSDWGQQCGYLIDTVGYNYAESLYDKHHAKHPQFCIYGSETSSTIQSRGIYHFPYEDKAVTHADHQCSSIFNCTTSWASPCTEYNITRDRAAEYCAGQYIWTGFDYIGEPTPYDTKNSYFGQLDTAGFPKDSYYAYRAEWTDGKTSPMVHITPSVWDFNEGEIIDVTVHTNAARSELYCNGTLVGSFDHDHTVSGMQISEFYKIPYVKGALTAVAYDENGNVVARDEVSSFGDPVRIVLEPEKAEMRADGRDLIYVAISTVDENGVFVGNGRSRMNVSVSGAGRLIGLDNGDSTDYEPYKCTSRRLFSGRLMAIIASNGKAGKINVTVSSPALPDASVTLDAIPAEIPEGIEIIDRCEISPVSHEIPLRKLELSLDGSRVLTKDAPSAKLTLKRYPENATITDVQWRAFSRGVVTDGVTLDVTDAGVTVTALADGEFRIRVSSKNDTPYEAIWSEICFTAEGIGEYHIDPYRSVPAMLNSYEETYKHAQESEGGIRFFDKDAHAVFRKIDFGKDGSDSFFITMMRVHVQNMLFSVYDVTDGGKTHLGTYGFTASNVWYTYSTSEYQLDTVLTGIRDLKFTFTYPIVFGCFGFNKKLRAFDGICAADCDVVYGDAYEKREDGIYGIGNNVTVRFSDLDLGEGASSVTVKAVTRNDRDSIRLTVGDELYALDFTKSEDSVTVPVELSGTVTADLVFLPGVDFDLFEIKFNK